MRVGPFIIARRYSYEAPFAAVFEIKSHLAFYPERVDSITVQPA